MTITSGQSIFGFFGRIAGTVIASKYSSATDLLPPFRTPVDKANSMLTSLSDMLLCHMVHRGPEDSRRDSYAVVLHLLPDVLLLEIPSIHCHLPG